MGLSIELDFRCNECGSELDSYQRGDTVDVDPCHSCLEDNNKVEDLEEEVKDLEEERDNLEKERDELKEQVESLECQIEALNEIIIKQAAGKD